MAELSLDFKNEIINEIINEKRRYVMTENEDGTVSFTDATSYSQTGTKYGAEEVIEEREQINQHTNVIGSDEFNSESSYSAGDYFIHNNKLCKALSAISAGAALSLGSNYQVTSIKDELSGLNGKIMPYIDYEIPGGGSVQINPSTTGFYYLVLLRSPTSVNYAAIILTGYGSGDIRYKYKKLDDGDIKTVEVSGRSFILSMNTEYNDKTQLRLYVLLGDIPNIV